MVIGINASSALKENPTGVEEYTFQVIKHLAMIPDSRAHRFILYLDSRLRSARLKEFRLLPDNFELKFLNFPFLWTQARLAWEMLFARIDILFIPVHVLPMIHPSKTIVALHGLEYEFYPEMYPIFHRQYLRWSTKYALQNASKIIAVSESTKKDLVKLYGGNSDKISVIYHGIVKNHELRIMNQELQENNCILYVGRMELKKNVLGIIEAFNKFKTQNAKCQTKLVLAGEAGFGFDKAKKAINVSRFKNEMILKGYISEAEKNNLLKNAALFIYPSFYEGFGMPILEAQAAGVPVVASNASSLPEIAGDGAIFVNPDNSREISEAIAKILVDKETAKKLIEKGLANSKRFSWEKCARETLEILTN